MTVTQNGSAIVKAPMAAIAKETASGFQLAAERAKAAFGNSDDFFAALEVAAAVDALRSYLDQPEIKARIMGLMNTPIGFRTDRDPKIKKWSQREGKETSLTAYSYDIVKDCVVEALLRGLGLVGNQFNIIAERFYCTKEGFEHLIKKLEFVTDFRPVIGIPAQKPGGAIIECSATWLQNGKPQSAAATIPVKGDEKYSSADQYIGKATRKFLKRCYEMMSGNSISDGDAEDSIQAVSVEPVFNQLPQSQTIPVSADVAAASVPAPSLTDGQLKQLRDSMSKVLAEIGIQAFEIDAASGYGVQSFADIPASRFTELMRNLGNAQFQQHWNQGLSVSGERIVEPQDAVVAPTQPAQPAQPAQAELIPAEPETRRQAPPVKRQNTLEDEL